MCLIMLGGLMNENTLINSRKYRGRIFDSLMAVEFHTGGPKSQDELLKEVKEAEDEGQLRIYVPEED